MKYVLAFRRAVGRQLTAEEEASWPAWFGQIGDSVADFGNRVGDVREVGGDGKSSNTLGGYVVISAESLDAAATIASGCPILSQGGSVEVGEIVAA